MEITSIKKFYPPRVVEKTLQVSQRELLVMILSDVFEIRRSYGEEEYRLYEIFSDAARYYYHKEFPKSWIRNFKKYGLVDEYDFGEGYTVILPSSGLQAVYYGIIKTGRKGAPWIEGNEDKPREYWEQFFYDDTKIITGLTREEWRKQRQNVLQKVAQMEAQHG